MFNRKSKGIIVAVLVLFFSLGLSQKSVQAITNGWKASGNSWYYYQSGKIRTNAWIQDSTKQWYYLGANGAMKTGWHLEGSKWYYLGADGAWDGKNPTDSSSFTVISIE